MEAAESALKVGNNIGNFLPGLPARMSPLDPWLAAIRTGQAAEQRELAPRSQGWTATAEDVSIHGRATAWRRHDLCARHGCSLLHFPCCSRRGNLLPR